MVKKILLSLIGVLVFAAGAFAQAKQVRGSVVDENGAAVIGASVIVKGTTIGVSTDQQGFFVMNNVPAKSEELQISYLGYVTQDVKIRPNMQITLVPDEQTIESVVVTGMTKTDKRLFTGAADRLSADDVKLSGMADISRGLEGRSAGVSQDPRPRCDVDLRQLEAPLGCGRRHYGGCDRHRRRRTLFG